MEELFLPYREVIQRMDECSERGIPFFFAVDFEQTEGIFIPSPYSSPSSEVYFSIGEGASVDEAEPLDPLQVYPESFERYSERFAIVRNGLMRGDSFLLNLTLRTSIYSRASLEEIYHKSVALYKVCVPGRFVCFSPERFVRIDSEGTILTSPMKGTIDASLPNAEEVILQDYKESAEHATVVDLLRNDLNRVSTQVQVLRYRYLTEVVTPGSKILQVSSDICGKLHPDLCRRLGTVLDSLLPAGSICGAPREKTLEIIREAEGIPRGFYSGICGIYDGNTLDTGVMIRFIEKDSQGNLYYRSGGGITINSNPEEEYREVLQKIYLPLANN